MTQFIAVSFMLGDYQMKKSYIKLLLFTLISITIFILNSTIFKILNQNTLNILIIIFIVLFYKICQMRFVLYFCHDLSPQPVPKSLFCDNKALKPYRIQLFTQPVDIHRKCILVHIRITLPQLFH